MHKLAIVIPAYKIKFFSQTLESIAKQTCQNFTLYIGNDSSPEDLGSIVKKFYNRIDIKYKRFDENLGRKDLISHWERCIDLIEGEEWIWLFSDDDKMDPTCVEDFFQTLNLYPNFDLFHFNTIKIDENDNIKSRNRVYPDIYSSEEFLIDRLKGKTSSYAVEYIFRKSTFFQMGRFPKFDLGWGTDDVLWIRLGKKSGIKSIDNSQVYWRKSGSNISSINFNKDIVKRKLYSQIKYANWAINEIKNERINISYDTLKKYLGLWLFNSIKFMSRFLSFKSTNLIISEIKFLWEAKEIKIKTTIIHASRIYFILKLKIKFFIKKYS